MPLPKQKQKVTSADKSSPNHVKSMQSGHGFLTGSLWPAGYRHRECSRVVSSQILCALNPLVRFQKENPACLEPGTARPVHAQAPRYCVLSNGIAI